MFSFFERRIDPFPSEAAVAAPPDLWRFILHYARPVLGTLIVVALLSALIAGIEISVYAFMGRLIDFLEKEPRDGFFTRHTWLPWVLAAMVLLPTLVTFAWELIFYQSFIGNFPMRIRYQAHQYLLRQSLSFFHDEMAGRVSTTMMQTALAVREVLTKLLDVLVYFSVYVTSGLVLLAASDWRLAAPLFAWVVVYGLTLFYFIPRLGRIAEEQAEARSTMTGRIVDAYSNILTVKLFAHSRSEMAYTKASMTPFLGTVYRQMRMVTLLNGLLHVENYGMIAALAYMSVMLWQQDLVSLGAIAVAIGLATRLQGYSQWILWEMAALFEAIGTVRDGARLLSHPIAVNDGPDAKELHVSDGVIEFRDVAFSYDGTRQALQGVTLTIKKGERVGLIGRSGAGKSTLVSLLLRLYDLKDGAILIDGQNVAAVTQESLRHRIGLVTQDTALLHRSVADNIAYGKAGATRDAIEAAARAANAHDFILDLSDARGRKAYDAHVGERGVKLSGGQRQRIAIARVMLKNAPILVLDEATSALDSEVEAAIQDNLAAMAEGKTMVAIAHRLSTIAAMDRLVVMDRGRIVEEGTHQSLLALGGLYADLWARQSGGFLGDQDTETAQPG